MAKYTQKNILKNSLKIKIWATFNHTKNKNNTGIWFQLTKN